MIGSDVPVRAPHVSAAQAAVGLEVVDLVARDLEDPDRRRVDGVSLTVRRGEIVGLFGLVGAGCGATASAIFGSWEGRVEGVVRVDGQAVSRRSPADGVAAGLALMSQDRRQTLVGDQSIAENIVLASLRSLATGGLLDAERRRAIGRDYVNALDIRAPSADVHVGTLSGGNQQKVQVARWLFARSTVLLLDDPTRGVDVGARAEIHRLLLDLTRDGKAILLVSSEAEELIEVCDRILVMRAGSIVLEVPAAEASEAILLEAAAGQ